ncbi:uncharacterized protein EV154DRAFT_483924 [Mucor mucedo]|uniref:uncharacterized protein n=1 Tax=Mucor mucedo TaxID=29922 RepID=UPI00221F2B05|nr:uncharacterized protein EV154DRAFT_483924 [Mucor mucedo]KAI7888581.1 hypothetical protein EV154DRAFT_483924 [Mucor mucedo]
MAFFIPQFLVQNAMLWLQQTHQASASKKPQYQKHDGRPSIKLNNLQFTVLPMQFPDGTVVKYATTTPTPTPAKKQVAPATTTTSINNEWKISTKRAIEHLDQEIKRLSSSIWVL